MSIRRAGRIIGNISPIFIFRIAVFYLEHWGIDRDGNTAPSVDKKKYHEGMEWKRGVHEKHGTRLIETYYYEHAHLLTGLDEKLTQAGRAI